MVCDGRILERVAELKKSGLKQKVESGLKEFRKAGNGTDGDIFKELCFCLLTANYSAEGGIRIQEAMGDGFLTLDQEKLRNKLKELGHRFPNARANYIFEARKHKNGIRERISSFGNGKEAREWFAENVKGLG